MTGLLIDRVSLYFDTRSVSHQLLLKSRPAGDDAPTAAVLHRISCRRRHRRVVQRHAGCPIEEESGPRPPPWTGCALALRLAKPSVEVGQCAAWRTWMLERCAMGDLGTGSGCGCDEVAAWADSGELVGS